MSTGVKSINPPGFGPPIAPYAQGTAAGDLIFVAGQVALDKDNAVIAPGDAKAQTLAAIDRVEAILSEEGASLADVATATVFITDRRHFGPFNEAWAEKFGDHRPARATVIAGLLIDGLVVEVQAIAVRPRS
jgi:2-iminobutanoate/2-iminopropanoate deaminase